MRVKFMNIGGNNANWEAECPELSEDWLYQQVTSSSKIMSKEIDFFINEKATGGIIVAGFHKIGEFTFE